MDASDLVRQIDATYHYNRSPVVRPTIPAETEMCTYQDLTVPLLDPGDWTLAKVLRSQASARPRAIYLDAPDEARRWPFARPEE
jgi:hypothetical protein